MRTGSVIVVTVLCLVISVVFSFMPQRLVKSAHQRDAKFPRKRMFSGIVEEMGNIDEMKMELQTPGVTMKVIFLNP